MPCRRNAISPTMKVPLKTTAPVNKANLKPSAAPTAPTLECSPAVDTYSAAPIATPIAPPTWRPKPKTPGAKPS